MKGSSFWNLYKVGLSRIRTLGLIYTIGTFILNVVTMIPDLVAAAVDPYAYKGLEYIDAYLFAPAVLAAAILTVVQFSFLNSRSNSDFFHALPAKREKMYWAFSLAVATWTFIGIGVSAVTNIALFAALPFAAFSVDYIVVIAAFAVAALLVQGGIQLAMSLTGTYISNAATAALILFGPRIVIKVFTSLCDSGIMLMVPIGGRIPLLDININLIFGLFLSGKPALSAIIYSLCLGVIYMIAGMFIFKRRKSESAEQSAQSGVMQCVIRTLVAFMVALPAIYYAVTGYYDEVVIVSLLLSVLVYFSYEAITQRSFRTFGKAAWQVVFLVLLVGTFTAMPLLLKSAVIAGTPTIDEVAAIYVDDSNYAVRNYTNIHGSRTSNIKITDEKIVKFAVEEAQDDVRCLKEGYHIVGTSFTIRYVLKDGGEKVRRVYLLGSTTTKFYELLTENEEYLSALVYKPEKPDCAIFNMSDEIQISADLGREVYDVFYEEYSALTPKQQLTTCHLNNEPYPTNGTYLYIEADGLNGRYSLPPELFPKTINAVYSGYSRITETYRKRFIDTDVEWFEGTFIFKNSERFMFGTGVRYYDDNDINDFVNYIRSLSDDEQLRLLKDLAAKPSSFDYGKIIFAEISYEYIDKNGERCVENLTLLLSEDDFDLSADFFSFPEAPHEDVEFAFEG